MDKNIIIVLGFVIAVIFLCKLWHMYVLKIYQKKEAKKSKQIMNYGVYIDSFEKLELAGIGNDGNSDYEFIQAVNKIHLSDDIRIKIYE